MSSSFIFEENLRELINACRYCRKDGKTQCVLEWTFFKMVKEKLFSYEKMSVKTVQTLCVFLVETCETEQDSINLCQVRIYLFLSLLFLFF